MLTKSDLLYSKVFLLWKWLTNECSSSPIPPIDFSVKNSIEFIDRIKNIKLGEGELLVSFDVTSLIPRIPIDVSLKYLEHLLVIVESATCSIRLY